MKVHRRVRIPSPLLSSLTKRITLNSRKKVMEMRAFSSTFCRGGVKSSCTNQSREKEKSQSTWLCFSYPARRGHYVLMLLYIGYLVVIMTGIYMHSRTEAI